MVFYAEDPARRTRQIVIDLVFAIWVLIAISVGVGVHDAVSSVADRTRGIDTAASSLADRLSDAGDLLDGTPLIGDDITRPFDGAAGAAEDVGRTGIAAADDIDTLATLLGLAVVLVLVLLAAPYYAPARLRFIITATAVRRVAERSSPSPAGSAARSRTGGPTSAVLRAPDADADLLALRALVGQPVRRLAVVPDAAAGWRSADPATVAALANLQLSDSGLRSRYAAIPPGEGPSTPPTLGAGE